MSVLYQRSLEIERRLEDVLGLIRRGRYSTPRIAAELQVSIPTVSRPSRHSENGAMIFVRKDRGPPGDTSSNVLNRP